VITMQNVEEKLTSSIMISGNESSETGQRMSVGIVSVSKGVTNQVD
jgi:hypothetical protein